jgi:hypothetical protein
MEVSNMTADGTWILGAWLAHVVQTRDEDTWGVEVITLENPGWRIRINLAETLMSSESFDKVAVNRSEEDWIHCRVVDGVFEGRGGIWNLREILENFRSFANRGGVLLVGPRALHEGESPNPDSVP